ncbi:MAG: Re/Si-specific NAD(P)(+) transhydrogenase subunit alpha [Phycisphaerae bacterium]
MIIGVPRELARGERRVAATPASAQALLKLGHKLRIEAGAGLEAGFTDEAYREAGVDIVESREALFQDAELILQVRTPGAARSVEATDGYRHGQVVLGFAEPLTAHDQTRRLCDAGVTLLALEMLPRITRAQSMDALSSQANLAGYQAVLTAATHIPRVLPMMMTAAGTVKPARVLVVGAGVAGLQAIATAKRLGAMVSAYDVRPAVKEQVQSLAAKFVELDIGPSEEKGGYAGQLSEAQLERQREQLVRVVGDSDVVITTAAVPGKRAPVIVTADMVRAMSPGSVIVDLAAERGGNCELTRPDEDVVENGITIIGDTNLVSQVAYHASQLYAQNLVNLIKHLSDKDGSLKLAADDEITRGVLVCRDEDITSEPVRSAMGLATPEASEAKEN